jgi:hypothetical protein
MTISELSHEVMGPLPYPQLAQACELLSGWKQPKLWGFESNISNTTLEETYKSVKCRLSTNYHS